MNALAIVLCLSCRAALQAFASMSSPRKRHAVAPVFAFLSIAAMFVFIGHCPLVASSIPAAVYFVLAAVVDVTLVSNSDQDGVPVLNAERLRATFDAFAMSALLCHTLTLME